MTSPLDLCGFSSLIQVAHVEREDMISLNNWVVKTYWIIHVPVVSTEWVEMQAIGTGLAKLHPNNPIDNVLPR